MADLDTLYGYIKYPAGAFEFGKRAYRHNRQVLKDHLPISDETPPFLNRGMFSIPPYRSDLSLRYGEYRYGVIHFAGTYKAMWLIESEWVEKFEALLSRLIWFEAVVQTAWSFKCVWKARIPDHEGDYMFAQYAGIPPKPPSQWTFNGYRLEQEELPPEKAINTAPGMGLGGVPFQSEHWYSEND